MGKLLVSLLVASSISLCFASGSYAGVTVEKDAIISSRFEGEQGIFDSAANLIRAFGYRCDSLSAFRPFIMSRGFTVVCNKFAYTYELQDRGGNWVVNSD